MPKMTGAQRWACWALFLLTVTGLALTTDTESYSELLKAVKDGSFSLDGKGKDDAKAVLQQILDKSEYQNMQYYFIKSPVSMALHTMV